MAAPGIVGPWPEHYRLRKTAFFRTIGRRIDFRSVSKPLLCVLVPHLPAGAAAPYARANMVGARLKDEKKKYTKSTLPSKICVACGRPMNCLGGRTKPACKLVNETLQSLHGRCQIWYMDDKAGWFHFGWNFAGVRSGRKCGTKLSTVVRDVAELQREMGKRMHLLLHLNPTTKIWMAASAEYI